MTKKRNPTNIYYSKKMSAPTEGIKHDQEKSAVQLLSSMWVLGVGDVLAYGKAKYAADNWRKGIESRRLLGAALRHILAYLGGEDKDSESGLSHILHASCSLMFAYELSQTHPELDDRYKEKKKK